VLTFHGYIEEEESKPNGLVQSRLRPASVLEAGRCPTVSSKIKPHLHTLDAVTDNHSEIARSPLVPAPLFYC